jgi:N-formylglutamate deformylase
MNQPYYIIEPKVKKVPFILSVPHCGIEFPDEIKDDYKLELRNAPDDTDWFVQDLYNFATELGITIIYAKYSRWVIDLNRDPESKPLYNDGRIITALTTTTDFFGNKIYVSEDHEPNEAEINRRLTHYYWPYYEKITSLLSERIEEFGKVLLWDAHSIRELVPTIRADKFPEMILGNNEEKTASKLIIETALSELKKGAFEVSHNYPFKGGHITRYFGKPEENTHALQLEMNKILYMNDDELVYNNERAEAVRTILKPTFEALINTLNTK